MRFSRVKFNKFSVNPDEIINTLPQYKAPYWNEHWSVVLVEHKTDTLSEPFSTQITEWLRREAQSRWDIHPMGDGYLVAFEDDTDSILFKVYFGVY